MAADAPKPKPFGAGGLAELFGQQPPAAAGGGEPLDISAFLDALTSPSSGALAPHKPIIRDRWFKDQTVHLDGYIFEGCRFDRCKLMTESATFTFRRSYIAPDCQLYFHGPSLKIARLLMHQLASQGRISRDLREAGMFAVLHGDGTFTLE